MCMSAFFLFGREQVTSAISWREQVTSTISWREQITSAISWREQVTVDEICAESFWLVSVSTYFKNLFHCYGFWDNLNRIWPKSANFQIRTFLFSIQFNAVFLKNLILMSYELPTKGIFPIFIRKRGTNSEILHIWKIYTIHIFLSNFDMFNALNFF